MWYNGNVEIPGATANTYTPSLPKDSESGKYIPGKYTYTVTVSDGTQCGNTSHTVNIVVKPQPSVIQ